LVGVTEETSNCKVGLVGERWSRSVSQWLAIGTVTNIRI